MDAKEKIHSLSRVSPQSEDMDTVKYSMQFDRKRGVDVLLEAQRYWDNMYRFRKDRDRNKRYTNGDQWGDFITADGKDMTEEAYIKSQGSIPLKNNLIRRLVRNVLGVYRSQSKEPTCTARDRDEQKQGETMSVMLQYNMQLNKLTELNARTMEEFLISGFCVHRKWYGWKNDKLDCWTNMVQPNNFFIDSNMRDVRGWDATCVGEIHDVSFQDVCREFAHSKADFDKLKEIYYLARKKDVLASNYKSFGYDRLSSYDFLYTDDASRCRVIEVWRKEVKPRYRCHDYNNGDIFKIELEDYAEMVEKVNQDRIARGTEAGMQKDDIPLITVEWFMDDYWYYYYLSPFGDILDEGETPYAHKSHPYVFKAYPFIDGEIHSFVADVIDQQRYVNRLITMYDWIMRASAKGVLLFPEEALPAGMSIDDIADEWGRFNGVIAIKAKPGVPLPQQISNNATNIGVSELLNIQLKFFEDISGVHGALQGRSGNAGTSGTLYSQQTQNATMSLLDILDSFSQFVVDGAHKDVKNIQQFYDTKRVVNIAGKAGSTVEYDPQRVKDVEFDLSITESTSTPVYREMANQFLMQIWQSGQITLQQLLAHGDFPFADELLQSIKTQEEQMQNGQAQQGLNPQLMQQAQQGVNMSAVNSAYNMMKPA